MCLGEVDDGNTSDSLGPKWPHSCLKMYSRMFCVRTSATRSLSCKLKRQYLLTLQVSMYWLSGAKYSPKLCSANTKAFICLLYKSAATAFWLCRVELRSIFLLNRGDRCWLEWPLIGTRQCVLLRSHWLAALPFLIEIFTHLKLCLAAATNNFKWAKITHISSTCLIWDQIFPNL